LDGISKSEVSRICAQLDGDICRWRNRPLSGSYPYLWLDATYLKVREDGRVMSQAVIVAYAVRETGEREVVGLEIGYSEEGPFWVDFLRTLVERGLAGVQLVISDAHRGLREAIDTIMAGATWQRCRVHFLRNAMARVPRRADRALVAAAIRAIFAQPEKTLARQQLRIVADGFRPHYGMVASMLEEAEDELLAYMSFPPEHWRQLYSTNPLERINKEIKRRSKVVGIFPNRASVIRLVGALMMEQQDEWEVCRRYFSLESMKKTLDGLQEESLVALLKG
jgi:transposase-like protein